MAQQFGSLIGIPADETCLQRVRYTAPQVELNAEERQKNVRDAFAAHSKSVINKNILLIDDVCTTGATLAAAATVLLNEGAQSVSGYCLARAM